MSQARAWTDNIRWLSDLPQEWTVTTVGRIAALYERRNESHSDKLLSLSSYTGVREKEYDDENRVRSGKDLARYWAVQPKHLVVNPMWLNHGSIAVSRMTGVISPDYRVYDLREDVYPAYAHFVFCSPVFLSLYGVLTRGHTTYDRRISKYDFSQLPFVVPPLPTQKAIADYLDRKTAAIDALIEKKQKLLDLLAEKRAALINQAVTKGLDPDVPMKDSGVPWIGEIPAHWQMHRLRRVVRRFVDYRGRTPEKTEEGVPLITAGAVRGGKVDHARAPEWVSEEVHAHLILRGRPEIGDLLFTSEAPLGEVALIEDPGVACAQRIIMFKVERERISSRFLLLHFLSGSGRGEIWSRASGSTAEGIRADRLKMSLVPTPPVEEQLEISDYVEAETSGFDELHQSVVDQIERLREYRQALITAAVTGQLNIEEDAA